MNRGVRSQSVHLACAVYQHMYAWRGSVARACSRVVTPTLCMLYVRPISTSCRLIVADTTSALLPRWCNDRGKKLCLGGLIDESVVGILATTTFREETLLSTGQPV